MNKPPTADPDPAYEEAYVENDTVLVPVLDLQSFEEAGEQDVGYNLELYPPQKLAIKLAKLCLLLCLAPKKSINLIGKVSKFQKLDPSEKIGFR